MQNEKSRRLLSNNKATIPSEQVQEFTGVVMFEIGSHLVKGGLVYNVPMGKKFIPFEHDDLDLKNYLLDYARALSKKQDTESQLACSMIYASFAEYVAGHLLDTLRHLMYNSTYMNFAAIVYIDQRNPEKRRTMYKLSQWLRDYHFPDKDEIVKLIEEIANSRNNLFHNFANTSKKDLVALDEDIETIKTKTEELVSKVNVVYVGLQKILIPREQEKEGC